jgi:hypothetical protein
MFRRSSVPGYAASVRAPEIARHFATTILEFSDASAIQTARKSISRDLSYRPRALPSPQTGEGDTEIYSHLNA